MEVELTCYQCKKAYIVINLDEDEIGAYVNFPFPLCDDCRYPIEETSNEL